MIELYASLQMARKFSDIRISKYLRTCYKHVIYILSTHRTTSVQFFTKLIWINSGATLWNATADVILCEEINPRFLPITYISINCLAKRTKNYLQNLKLHCSASDLVVYIKGSGRFVITSILFPEKKNHKKSLFNAVTVMLLLKLLSLRARNK